jgi:predicted ATP-dependent endonuclease of OLD family
MRLRKFEVHNFKGIHEASFEWSDLITLIGENNSGKSSVLQALDWFLSGRQIRDEALFQNKIMDEDHTIELIGNFDNLTENEKKSIAVRGRMHDEQWIIKKRYWRGENDQNREEAGRWQEQYYSFSSQEEFIDWPSLDTSWGAFPQDYNDLVQQIPDRGTRPNNQTREALREIVRQQRPDLVRQTEPIWISNPGGGASWKSNANSIIPRYILVKAVHDASEEAISKESSTYGKIVNLIIEKKIMVRPEVVQLKKQMEVVLKLFRPDPENPEAQAPEIKELENRINKRLGQVIQGIASIQTSEVDLGPVLLPSTTLELKDREDSIPTSVGHQGHGLQRTLILTLLQILIEVEAETDVTEGERAAESRATILGVEEPELCLHPQMERKMRDLLFKLASQEGYQVICTTHSPVFLDMSQRHKSIVRVVKDPSGTVNFFQVTSDLFDGLDAQSERDRLKLIAAFHPTVNEVFFARRVVLVEERTTLTVFERAAELTGVFDRHPNIRRDITLIDCDGKANIPMFQKVLNHFQIPYTAVHDEDLGNEIEQSLNAKIESLLNTPHGQNTRYMISPTNIEGMLGYTPTKKDKPYQALKQIERLHSSNSLPPEFLSAMNWVYFGQDFEPAT